MQVTATVPRCVFSSTEDIYEAYTQSAQCIFYQGDAYDYQALKQIKDTEIHLYRCNSEMHNLIIYMRFGVPYLVEGMYSVGAVKL